MTTALQLEAVAGVFATAVSLVLANYFGIKTLMVWGVAIQVLTLTFAGFSIMQGYAVFGFICILTTSMAAIVGTNALSVFTIETVPDVTYVVYYSLSYVASAVAAKATGPMREALGWAGFFWFFAFFNILGLIYIYIFAKETRNLTDN